MRHVALALLPLSLAMACSGETPVAVMTQAAPSEPTLAGSPNMITESVTGTGHFTIFPDPTNPELTFWRTFTFAGLKRQNGSVSGQFEIHIRSLDVRIHGRITCFSIVGNMAWLGGVIEQLNGDFSPNPAVGPGTPARWRVVDRGQGANSPVDLVSGIGFFPGSSEGAELDYCQNQPAMPLLRPLEAGNIRVRGG